MAKTGGLLLLVLPLLPFPKLVLLAFVLLLFGGCGVRVNPSKFSFGIVFFLSGVVREREEGTSDIMLLVGGQ